jgi:hypothetical protein
VQAAARIPDRRTAGVDELMDVGVEMDNATGA